MIFSSVPKCSNSQSSGSKPRRPTETPANIETMVQQVMIRNAAETRQAVLSFTPTPTDTLIPTNTNTPIPTRTPWPTRTTRPTRTPVPAAPIYYPDQTYSNNSYAQSGTGVLGSVSQGSSGCVIKGNVNVRRGTKIYHCPNSPFYYETEVNPSQGDRWFCTEEEAISAGFRAPKNAPPCGGF